jgi:hypothetical protein
VPDTVIRTALFTFNQAKCTAVTDITVSGQVQTEGVRKFAGSTGLGIYRSGNGVTDCVELDCIGLRGKLCGTGLYRFGGQIVWNWTV